MGSFITVMFSGVVVGTLIITCNILKINVFKFYFIMAQVLL